MIRPGRASGVGLRVAQDPVLALGLALLVIFLWLIALPIGMIVEDGFTSQPGDSARTGVADGALTGYYLSRALASRMSAILFYAPLWNTLVVAVCASALALVIGALLAWVQLASTALS